MSIPKAYLTSARNITSILADVQKAGVPAKFTYDFLKKLGHPSSANRPVIGVLKALGFLTDSGEPSERYRRFKDPSQSKRVMAEALRQAYADVFTVDSQAYQRNANELKGIFARLSEKGDSVNEKMASTFKTLSGLADFEAPVLAEGDGQVAREVAEEETLPRPETPPDGGAIVVHHDVHVHLPATTDINVYDAIFRSLRENLR